MRDEDKTKEQLISELDEMRRRIAKLEKGEAERKRVEHNLSERVKELRCLYAIANIVESPDVTLDELYQEVVNLLPSSWQYPGITCARIAFDEKEFKTNNFKTTAWKQSASINVKGQKEGILEVYYLGARPEIDEGPFLKEERLLIDAVAERLGRITERKQAEEARVEKAAALATAEELRRSRQRIVTAQESLRREIAQHLHGSVQNRLVVLLHQLAELERAASSRELNEELGNLRQKLTGLLETHIRPIAQQLYPSILRRGLVPALQSLGDQFEAVLAIEMQLHEGLMRQERDNSSLIPEPVRLVAYRIAEETLTNVVKHAKASRVTLELEVSPEGSLRLTVRDNGQGFDMESTSSGLGIPIMQDYAELIGGKCLICSAPGEGTEVTATLPLAGSGAEHLERPLPLG